MTDPLTEPQAAAGGAVPVPADLAGHPRPTQAEAEAAVRTHLLWAGDDPDREGLLDTPNDGPVVQDLKGVHAFGRGNVAAGMIG